jgi:hypothetical protein
MYVPFGQGPSGFIPMVGHVDQLACQTWWSGAGSP